MIRAIASLRRVLRLLAVLTAFFAAAATFAQSQDPVLKTIIEKTREREAVYQNYEWNYSSTRRGADGAVVEMGKFRDILDGQRYFASVEESTFYEGEWHRYVCRQACDGSVERAFFREDEGEKNGVISRPDPPWRGPGTHFAVYVATRFAGHPAHLSEILQGDIDKLISIYGRRYEQAQLQVRVKPEEEIEGFRCQVVECVLRYLDKDGRDRGNRVHVFYFAPELNYSCVQVEDGLYQEDGLLVAERMRGSDFRELKDGIFFPHLLRLDSYDKEQTEIITESIDVEKQFDDSVFTFEFPSGTYVSDNVLEEYFFVGTSRVARAIARESVPEAFDSQTEQELPDTLESTQAIVRGTEAERPRQSAENTSGPWRQAIGTALIIVDALAIVELIIILPRRRASRRP